MSCQPDSNSNNGTSNNLTCFCENPKHHFQTTKQQAEPLSVVIIVIRGASLMESSGAHCYMSHILKLTVGFHKAILGPFNSLGQ